MSLITTPLGHRQIECLRLLNEINRETTVFAIQMGFAKRHNGRFSNTRWSVVLSSLVRRGLARRTALGKYRITYDGTKALQQGG